MKIAITGGIGSGKSFVCHLLSNRGIDVYDCEREAKRLMDSSWDIRRQLTSLVGKDVYAENRLNKAVLASFLLLSEENKQAVNNIVHPAVANDFLQTGLEWLESAILFDSGFHRRIAFDHVVCVTASLETRLERIMQRDSIARKRAMEWIGSQMPQEKVVERSDFEIVNDYHQNLDEQINQIIHTIYKH